jgi:tetratricopeptide (TPR) repeat protein
MSTQQPRPSAKAAAKRRAANRKRTRMRVRQMGAIFFVAIFVLGTATTAFVFNQVANQQASATGTTPVPGQTVVQVTPAAVTPTSGANVAQQIIDKGDQAAAKNDWKTAAGFYKSAIALSSSGNATLYYKYGKALGNTGDYAGAVANLQKALDLNPQASFAAETQQLVTTYKAKVTPGSSPQVSGTVTATPAPIK